MVILELNHARDAYYIGKPVIVGDMFDRVELKLRWYGSESVVKYLWCSLLRQSTYADAELYKGCLSEGIAVTVRCIKLKQKSLPQSLDQHMEVLSKLRHMHLVRVLGHCIASNHDHHQHAGHTTFSVQEYISNESLRDFLTDCRKKEVLKWPQRMAIDIGVARGIQFLHMGVAQGIFRKSLEIENILLAETLTVKISGYTIPLPSKGWSREPSSQKSSK